MRVAAICAIDTNTGCIKGVVPVKAAEDRPWSPRRGPARDAQCPHERRSGARGEGLWAPVGDQFTDSHAAELSLATRRRRSDGPKPSPGNAAAAPNPHRRPTAHRLPRVPSSEAFGRRPYSPYARSTARARPASETLPDFGHSRAAMESRGRAIAVPEPMPMRRKVL